MAALERRDPAIVWLNSRRKTSDDEIIIEADTSGRGYKPWPVYDLGIERYDDYFGEVSPIGVSIKDDLEHKRASVGRLNVFHPMGGVGLLRSISETVGLDYGLALGLTDHRSLPQRLTDRSNGLEMLTGDVFRHESWTRIREAISRRGIDGFDYIFCNPIGGWTVLGYDPLMHFFLLDRFWKMLSPNGGRLYIHFDSTRNSLEGQMWKDYFENYDLDCRGLEATLCITRGPEDPAKLPKPNWRKQDDK